MQVIYFNRAASASVSKYFSNTVQKVKGMHTSFECDYFWSSLEEENMQANSSDFSQITSRMFLSFLFKDPG